MATKNLVDEMREYNILEVKISSGNQIFNKKWYFDREFEIIEEKMFGKAEKEMQVAVAE